MLGLGFGLGLMKRGETVQDVLLASCNFTTFKRKLLPGLRARADAPPRQMIPGMGDRSDWFLNLSQLLQARSGALVRGFCLYELPRGHSREIPVWRCCFHAVVETRTPSGTVVYVDPNESRRPCDAGAAYIFVPSSRVHTNLSDAQLLSGEWLVGSVLLGEVHFCQMVLVQEQGRGRKASVVALTPETLLAKRNLVARLLPYFGEWARLRAIQENPETLGELMGMPLNDAEADEPDAVASYQAVMTNPESYVDGMEGLTLELSCREGLFAGTMTLVEARELFFKYFDRTYHAMRKAQLDAVTDRLVTL